MGKCKARSGEDEITGRGTDTCSNNSDCKSRRNAKNRINLDEWQEEILKTSGNICLCSGRQTGKSTIISIKAGEAAVNNKNFSVLIISATERQAEELFIKVLMYLDDNYKSYIKKGSDRPTKHQIKLNNGSIIRCLPTGLTGLGIRGFTINLLIADEAAFIPDEVWSAVTPMLLTTGGDIILLSTPFGRRGYFYECFNDESFKTFHVNSEDIINNRPISESWNIIQKEKAIEFLRREKQRMTELEYSQEYLGQFVDELMQFFPDKLILNCMKAIRPETLSIARDYYIGIDVARMGNDETTFEIIDKRAELLIQIENIITTKTLTTETTRKVLELNDKYNFKKIYIDDGGLGVGIFDQLLEEPKTRKKIVAINNSKRSLDKDNTQRKKLLKEDLYNNLKRLMELGKIILLDDPEIFNSLKSIQYEYTDNGELKIYGKYSHIAEGLIRAAYSYKEKSLNPRIHYI